MVCHLAPQSGGCGTAVLGDIGEYLINGDIVETEDEVLSLLALEKGRICELLISYFNNSNCIEVNIGYYKGRIKHKRA